MMRNLTITSSITSREEVALDKYLAEIGKEKLITVEEEVFLAREIRKGSQAALDKLVKANLRFVVSVAKHYQNKGMTLTDLINEGNLGLIKAAQKFDETRGFKFISYAVWWIRQGMMQAMAEHSRAVRLPLNRHAMIRKVKNGMTVLEQKLERAPSAEEIAELLDISIVDVEAALSASGSTFSIDAPLPSGDGSSFSDTMSGNSQPPDERLMSESLRTDITRMLSLLRPKEAEVLTKYYGIGLRSGQTLDEIGIELNLTRERVRQLKESALKRLRQSVSRRALSVYLG